MADDDILGGQGDGAGGEGNSPAAGGGAANGGGLQLSEEQVSSLVDQLVEPLGEAMAPAFQQTADAVAGLEQRLAGQQSAPAQPAPASGDDAAQTAFTELYTDRDGTIGKVAKDIVAETIQEQLGPVMRSMLGSQVAGHTAAQQARIIEDYGEAGWEEVEPMASETLSKMTPAQLADENTVRAAVNACISQDEIAGEMRKHYATQQTVNEKNAQRMALPGGGMSMTPEPREQLTPDEKDFANNVNMKPDDYLRSLTTSGRTLDDYLESNPERAKNYKAGVDS